VSLIRSDWQFAKRILNKPPTWRPTGVDRIELRRVATIVGASRLKGNAELVNAIYLALACTPQVRDGEISYDSGNPWIILQEAIGLIDDPEDCS